MLHKFFSFLSNIFVLNQCVYCPHCPMWKLDKSKFAKKNFKISLSERLQNKSQINCFLSVVHVLVCLATQATRGKVDHNPPPPP